jgi:hypothetical protein
MGPRWPMLPLHLDGFLAESCAAWPLHFPKPAPRGLSVSDFGVAFSIPDKRSHGIEDLEGAHLRCAILKTLEIEWRNDEMP